MHRLPDHAPIIPLAGLWGEALAYWSSDVDRDRASCAMIETSVGAVCFRCLRCVMKFMYQVILNPKWYEIAPGSFFKEQRWLSLAMPFLTIEQSSL